MLFKYDPGKLGGELKRKGYVHLRDVLSDEFVDHLRAFYAASMRGASAESAEWRIRGKKRQFLFDFPSQDAAAEFRAGIARLTGVAEDRLTVCERHLKVYDADAEPWPAPHKDRSASTFAIGLPVRLSEGSSVCIIPDLDPGPNPSERALFLVDVRPDIGDVYADERAVMLHEEVGDIVAFLGSALFHERVRPAGSAVLYIKVNGDGADPLGENIFAPTRAESAARPEGPAGS